MSGEYNIFSRIRDILDGNADAERQRKAGMQGQIDRADNMRWCDGV